MDVGPVTCTPPSGSTFPLVSTTVNCDATDPDPTVGTVSTSFVVTVVDTTPPVVSVPPNITGVQATGAGGATVSFAASATDIVDGGAATVLQPGVGVDVRHRHDDGDLHGHRCKSQHRIGRRSR